MFVYALYEGIGWKEASLVFQKKRPPVAQGRQH